MVHKRHRLGDEPVPGVLGDEPVHVLRHDAVGGVALFPGAQLQHVHRLAGVHLHGVADPERERHGIGRLLRDRRAS